MKPLLVVPGKFHLHALDTEIVRFLFEQRPQSFTANELADLVPYTCTREAYVSQMSRLARIHPLIQRRKRRTAKYIPFEYWYGVPSRKRGR